MVLASLRKTKIVQSGLSSLCGGALNCTARLDDKRRSLDTPSCFSFAASLVSRAAPRGAAVIGQAEFCAEGKKELYLVGRS